LGTAVPKDSTTCLDSICDVSAAQAGYGGEDELLVNIRIQSAFRSLLNNSSSAIVELIAEQIYNFVRTMQTENAIAADAMCALVQECTYANPAKYTPLYLKHVMENLKELNCEEKQHLEVLDAATMWFIYLGMVLFSVPSQIILKYKTECIQLHKMAISMHCLNAYQGACWSLTNVLTQLTEVYPLSENDQQMELNKPLKESLIIEKWGAGVVKDAVKMRWHVPDVDELCFAEQLIDEFVFKEILVLQTPEKMDKKAIKRSLYIVEKLLFCVGKRLPNFTTPIITLSRTEIPTEPQILSAMSPQMKTFSFRGENVRERVRQTMHNLIVHVLRLHDDQAKILEKITAILHLLTTRGSQCRFREKPETSSPSYEDPIRGKRVELYRNFEERVFALQKEIRPRSDKFTTSHLEILKDLVLLGTNSFTEVRIASQTVLIRILSKFPNAKAQIVKDITKYLDPSTKACHEEIKGALYMLIKGGFVVSSAPSVRCRCWLAIAKIAYSEKPSIIKLVERAYSLVSVESWSPAKNIISDRLRMCAQQLIDADARNSEAFIEFQKKIPKTDVEFLQKTKVTFNERQTKKQKKTATLRHELVMTCLNKGQFYHWRNVDCARSFLYTLHRNDFDVAALKIRDPQGMHGCGPRLDNLCVVYDEKKLPVDDDTWNGTVFVSKPHWGSYQWPKSVKSFTEEHCMNLSFCF
uniref:Proteasome activator complex subunit 4 (inferred by orthology to a human protein) n=1 Tax=Anisakis simplex TaxID=6269 RepID=A0A0M3K9L8_ANISI